MLEIGAQHNNLKKKRCVLAAYKAERYHILDRKARTALLRTPKRPNQLLSGAPFRTLRLCCSRRGGNWSWGSVVSHSLKSACGSSALSSFSRAGNQATTRCRFLRHSQSPA